MGTFRQNRGKPHIDYSIYLYLTLDKRPSTNESANNALMEVCLLRPRKSDSAYVLERFSSISTDLVIPFSISQAYI